MGRETASFRIREAGEGVAVLEVNGRLTAGGEAALLDAHTRLRTAGIERMVLALGPELSLDVGGLGLLVKLCVWAERSGQRLAVCSASALLRWVLRVARLDEGLSLRDDEPAALEALRGTAPPRPPGAPAPPAPEGEALCWPLSVGGPDAPRAAGPLQGFGPLWEKVHEARLAGASGLASEVAAAWKGSLGELWPPGNALRAPGGLRPGEWVDLSLATPGGALRTGALVLHADDLSFSLMTREGHLQAGWITFGVRDDGGVTVAEVRSLARSGDPLYEAGFAVAGHRQQEEFWHRTLEALAARFGVRAMAFTRSVCVDPHSQWGNASNAFRNAGLATALDAAAGAVGRVLRLGKR